MCKTLIIEDNSAFRKMFIRALTQRFPRVIIEEADDGRTAMEKFSEFKPDVVFMDIRLPRENGLNLTGKIKRLRPEVSVIVITDYDMPEYRSAAFQNGADCFIPKGGLSENFTQIEAIIEKVLGKKATIGKTLPRPSEK